MWATAADLVAAGLEASTANVGTGRELRRLRDRKELDFGTGCGASTSR